MFGLIALALIFGWLFASIAIATLIARRIPKKGIRGLVLMLFIPLLFALPVIDEIIGKYQFDEVCKEAKEIKIHATIPMGSELYFPDGKWRRSERDISLQEAQRIDGLTETLARWEHGKATAIPGIIPMSSYETKIFDRRDGRPLASYKYFSTRGGWISQQLEKPLVVRDQCFPADSADLYKEIFPFDSRTSRGSGLAIEQFLSPPKITGHDFMVDPKIVHFSS